MTTIDSIRAAVAGNIRLFRAEIGLTQEQLAERLDISTSHVANMERGATGISDGMLAEMCNVFGKRPAEFYASAEIGFDFENRVSAVVTTCVKSALEKCGNEISNGIMRGIAGSLALGGYSGMKSERQQLKKVASKKIGR